MVVSPAKRDIEKEKIPRKNKIIFIFRQTGTVNKITSDVVPLQSYPLLIQDYGKMRKINRL